MSTPRWISTDVIARIAGISPRAARKAVRSNTTELPTIWRGANLQIRSVRGAAGGGRSGLRYEVLASSLPLDLQECLRALSGPAPRALGHGEEAQRERDWWYTLIAPALAHPKHSRERGADIANLLARPYPGLDGKPARFSRKTLERKIDAYERRGLAGLGKEVRSDKGTARVVISAAWDAMVPLEMAIKEAVAEKLRSYIRSLYKAGTSIGMIHQLAGPKLADLTREAGFATTEPSFPVPRRFIEAEAQFRAVAVINRDQKAYEDARPRIRRTRVGMEPMQLVVGDVHHLDIVMRREDGSEAWPKAIAWLDQATNRIRLDLLLLGKGEGIRNADVIASFIRMTQDPAWGMPRGLYLDNGSEYRWADFADDALKLVERVEYGGSERSSQIVRARPYNASAKAIEGIFGILEQRYFCTLPGWAGGDRTNKKTAKVGRPTEPFPGTLQDLRIQIDACLTLYEHRPQRGDLKSRSPRQVYEAALTAGWHRTPFDPRELHSVFAVPEMKAVRQGAISHGGRRWSCPELQAFLGTRIEARIPKFAEPTVIPLIAPDGVVLGFATADTAYGYLDPEGARESDRRARRNRSAVRELERLAPDIDAPTEIARLAASLPPAPAAPIAGTISVNSEIAAGLAESSEERTDRQRQKAVLKHEARSADIAFLHKRLIGGRS